MSKFKVGDRVRYLGWFCHRGVDYHNCVATVKDAKWDYEIQFEDGVLLKTFKDYHLQLADRKTAFLTRLSELMREFDAKIVLDAKGSYCGDDVESITMSLCLNGEALNYTITDFDKEITPDNIMDYDKD